MRSQDIDSTNSSVTVEKENCFTRENERETSIEVGTKSSGVLSKVGVLFGALLFFYSTDAAI